MEDAYIIQGGKKLSGTVKLSGAKNVALKVIIAALLFDGEVILKNIPRINDVFELLHLIKQLGGVAEFIEKNAVRIIGKSIKFNKVDLLHASKIRVSFMMFAPLLYQFGKCYIPNPGGCRLGARSIDRIIEGLEKLGIKINYDSSTGYYRAIMDKKPYGEYIFNKQSHTATELLVMMSVFGNGQIIFKNAALEPEIDDLISFLNQSGADIKRNNGIIIVNGVSKLVQKNSYTIPSDRNEAVTYAVMAMATGGDVTIYPIREVYINTFIKKLRLAGAIVEKINDETWRFQCTRTLESIKIETASHPGFMTDWQPPWAVLMTQARGSSIIIERVFENRFAYVEELKKLGASIDYIDVQINKPSEYFFFNYDQEKKYKQAIKIHGGQQMHGGVLNIADLRAGATLVIACLLAKGESVVYGASILERGYEDFVEKISSLGGRIKKV